MATTDNTPAPGTKGWYYLQNQQGQQETPEVNIPAVTPKAPTQQPAATPPVNPGELHKHQKAQELETQNNATVSPATVSTPTTTSQETAVDRYRKMLEETDKREKALEKKQRTRKIVAAIGEGLSALSNLYYTNKGAASTYDPRNSLLPKMQERYDKLKAERLAKDKEEYERLERAHQWDYKTARDQEKQEKEKALQEYKQQKEREAAEYKKVRDKKADERWNKEFNRKTQNDEKAEEWRKKNFDQKDAHNKGQQALGWARINNKDYPTLTLDGKTREYQTDEDYAKAVHTLAAEYGIPISVEEVVSPAVKSPNGRVIAAAKTKSTKKSIGQLAAEVERENSKRRAGAKSVKNGKGAGYGQSAAKGKGY